MERVLVAESFGKPGRAPSVPTTFIIQGASVQTLRYLYRNSAHQTCTFALLYAILKKNFIRLGLTL